MSARSHGMSRSERAAWAAEFDRRRAAGAKTRKQGRGESQIQDDAGNWYRRGGDACCGCGRNAQAEDHHPGGMHVKPRWRR